jgi:hypothetical protein
VQIIRIYQAKGGKQSQSRGAERAQEIATSAGARELLHGLVEIRLARVQPADSPRHESLRFGAAGAAGAAAATEPAHDTGTFEQCQTLWCFQRGAQIRYIFVKKGIKIPP